MKNIEDFIREKDDIFNMEEPMDGHLDRFSWKLEKRFHSHTEKRSIVPYLLRAAVVTLLITISSLWTWEHFIRKDNSGMSLGQVSPQYREVENYYIHQVNIMESELGSEQINNNPEQREILKKEMKSMDSVYVQLQKELKANPNDERIINAMIQHYQMKVEVLNYIITQLKEVKNGNTNKEKDGKVSL